MSQIPPPDKNGNGVDHVEDETKPDDKEVNDKSVARLVEAFIGSCRIKQKPSGNPSFFGFGGQRFPLPKSFGGPATAVTSNVAATANDENTPASKTPIPTIKVTPAKDGYDTDTADYVPPDPSLPKFQWPPEKQNAECHYLEFKGKRRRSNDKADGQKPKQSSTIKGSQQGKSLKNPPPWRTAKKNQKTNKMEPMDIDYPPKMVVYVKILSDWKPYIGKLFTDPEGIYINDSSENNKEDRFRKCNFYLGGTEKSWGLLVYNGAPCTLILEKFYNEHVAGKVIPWVFGSELSFVGSCAGGQPDGNCIIPLARLDRTTHNPYRFMNGENFYQRFGIKGIGMVPMIIGRTPILLQGLIVEKIWPTKEQRNGPLGTIPIILGPDFHQTFERFLTTPSGSSESMHLLIPSAPPSLDILTLRITRRRELQFNVSYRPRDPERNQNGGVGVFLADKSMFNVSLPQPTFAVYGLAEQIWAHFKAIQQLEILLYAHGYRAAIDCVAIYSSCGVIVDSMNNQLMFRQLLEDDRLDDEGRQTICFGWSELMGAIDRLKDNGVEISFSFAESKDNKREHAEGAGKLAFLAQKIQTPMYPTCSGISKQKPVEDLEEDGLAAKELCTPFEDGGDNSSTSRLPSTGNSGNRPSKPYLIMSSDYKRPRFISGFEMIEKEATAPEDYKRQL